MGNVKKMYEGYWQSKKGLEEFENYERNRLLFKLFKKGGKILDLASGEGAVSEFLQNLGCDVTSFDISEEALKKAKKRGLKTIQGDVEKKLPFVNESFDAVFWGDNAEHLFLPSKTLEEIKRILKKEGKLVISCPNMGYWRYRISYLLTGMIPQTEWSNYDPWEWEHIRFFNKKVMTNFLEKGGFKMNSFQGVSRRRIDKLFINFNPNFFGMIMVVCGFKPK